MDRPGKDLPEKGRQKSSGKGQAKIFRKRAGKDPDKGSMVFRTEQARIFKKRPRKNLLNKSRLGSSGC
jgi:hypothetical protein